MSPEHPEDESLRGLARVRYWASARAAAGVAEETCELAGPVSLSELIRLVSASQARPKLAGVLASCSVLVGDLPVTSADPDTVVVRPGEVVEFLPPFAGG